MFGHLPSVVSTGVTISGFGVYINHLQSNGSTHTFVSCTLKRKIGRCTCFSGSSGYWSVKVNSGTSSLKEKKPFRHHENLLAQFYFLFTLSGPDMNRICCPSGIGTWVGATELNLVLLRLV